MNGCDWSKKKFSVYLQTKNNPKAMNWDEVFKKDSRGVTSAENHGNKGGKDDRR